jgi:Uma2 family endonuclease
MAANVAPFLSPEEYLEIDSKNDRPSEYFRGQMVPIEDSTRDHTLIATNLSTAISISLQGKNAKCLCYGHTLRVHMPDTGLYAYPDIVVTCGEEKFERYDTLRNPILIIEVLSPSTQDYDRGGKFASYRSIPSLEEYWTVAQDRAHVDRWTIVNAHWTLTEYSRPEDVIVCPNLEIALSNIYRDIQFTN